jgi:L-seryl-tRNA(Ser) seleniumtransferase
MKVSKEEIIALLVALDLFTSGAYDTGLADARRFLETIAGRLHDAPVRCTIIEEGDGETLPNLEIAIDAQRLGRNAFDVCRRLRRGQPPVYVGHGRLAQGVLVINPLCLNPDRAEALATRLHEELTL